jgi:hypothetical protein
VRKLTLLLPALLLAAPARAEEGMWMPQQIPDLAPRLRALGFEGDPNAFADLTGQPMGAIVSLGGCSASFVSPDGLIATNHHCVQSALQFNSTPERNLIEDGWLAKSRADELWNGPGSRVYVTTRVREVTAEVLGKVPARLSDLDRHDRIERRQKELVAKCEKPGVRCTVASFFEGARWFEIAQDEIQDVRLVYAPPASIGNFGGETDNWMWPRHTGDFSFYRAYVGKDGKLAPYAKDNVPYRPARWLKVSPAGASEGDLVIVAGYPGKTQRLKTYAEVKEQLEWVYPRTVRRYREMLALLDRIGDADADARIAVATRVRGLANTMKNREGVLEGAARDGLLAQKQAAEKELNAWIEADPKRNAEFGGVIAQLDALQAKKEQTRERDATFESLFSNSLALGSARTILRLAEERAKPDIERDLEYQERNWRRIREKEERAQRSLTPKADRALLRYALLEAAALPGDQRIPALDRAVGLVPGRPEAGSAQTIDAYLDSLYAGTKLFDKATRLGLLEKSRKEVAGTKDTFLALAAALLPADAQLRRDENARYGARSRLGPVYAKALVQKAGGLLAPDANSTLRITYGTVKGVSPRDGVSYLAQTTIRGIPPKHRKGDEEFHVPEKLLGAIGEQLGRTEGPFVDPKLGTVPVDFLSSVDTTGGNSGSAVLNGRGEFVGLLFDGTYETIASDFIYDQQDTRSIQVDSRYVLWVTKEFSGATHLLEEMGITADPKLGAR